MALLVAGALFMEILDATIIAPAIPLIASSFGVDAVDVNVAISAYLVTVAVLIPASGSVNIPIGVIGIVLALRLVRGGPHATVRPLDWPGLLALGSGIAAALIALENIRVSGTDWELVTGCGAAALVLLATAVWRLVTAAAPLMQLRVLQVHTLRITVVAGSLYRLVITAVPFLLPLQFQLQFGWTPLAAGVMVAALFAGNLTIKPATTPLMRRFGIRTVLLVNGVASVACFGLLAALRPGLPLAVIAVVLYLSGALRSVGFTAYNSLAFSDVDGERLTHANTLNASVQELAAGLGVAVAALLLSQFSSYSATYLVLGALLALTVVATVRLPRQAGAHVSGHRA